MEAFICYTYKDGIGLYTPDAIWVDKLGDNQEEVKFGYLTSDLKNCYDRGQGTAITQFYNLVIPGLILARHIFEGLERPLYCDDDTDGDRNKRIYTWQPTYDFEYDRANESENRLLAPKDKVFAVIVTPNTRHIEQHPDIKAWVDRWSWVDKDDCLNEAPINWVDRYENKIWTRV